MEMTLPSPDSLPEAQLEPRAASVEDTAKCLSIGRNAVYGLIHEGQLDAIKIRTRTLVVIDSIDALIQKAPRATFMIAEISKSEAIDAKGKTETCTVGIVQHRGERRGQITVERGGKVQSLMFAPETFSHWQSAFTSERPLAVAWRHGFSPDPQDPKPSNPLPLPCAAPICQSGLDPTGAPLYITLVERDGGMAVKVAVLRGGKEEAVYCLPDHLRAWKRSMKHAVNLAQGVGLTQVYGGI